MFSLTNITPAMLIAKLPLELFHLIVDEVKSPSDLYHLLFVSRGINHWAERALYHTIDFSSSAADVLRKALSAAVKVATFPHLGRHVQYVSIYSFSLPESFPFSQFFHTIPNLKTLKIHITDPTLCAIEPGNPFRLRSFACSWSPEYRHGVIGQHRHGIIGRQLVAFLDVQIDLEHLEVWTKPILTSDILLSSGALPKLSVLLAHHYDIRTILPGRNGIKCLNTTPDRSNPIDQPAISASNIYTLCIRNTTSLSVYSQCFPTLRFLAFAMDTHAHCRRIPPCLMDLPVLEKLKIDIGHKIHRSMDPNDYILCPVYDQSMDPHYRSDWLLLFITQKFLACPSLQRIEIRETLVDFQKEPRMWIRDVEAPIATRWDNDEWYKIH